jgi:hypothetical protein
MSKYQEHADQLEAVAKAHDQAERVRLEIENFLHRHIDTIIQCDANRSIICEYFHGDLDDITKATLEDCWENHERFRESLACHQSEAEVRAAQRSRESTARYGKPNATTKRGMRPQFSKGYQLLNCRSF